jgi:hypothetical protein
MLKEAAKFVHINHLSIFSGITLRGQPICTIFVHASPWF